jgi:hypothetical protein
MTEKNLDERRDALFRAALGAIPDGHIVAELEALWNGLSRTEES